MKDGVEILMDALSMKARRFMQAMIDDAPAGASVTSHYRGLRRLLMLYGPGSPAHMPAIQRHRAAGGRVAMWDLGYWDRPGSMRLSVDGLHPTAEQLAMAPDGPGRREFALREDADPAGPILLIGMGPKSVFAYGTGAGSKWERSKVNDLQRRFPGRTICWRPKGPVAAPLGDLPLRHSMPIEEALRGCSLVVCRHSNVAVDAAVAGVPVECEDGAALALYAGNPAPSREQRAEFLRRLTWWNWTSKEAPAAWAWLQRVAR